MSKRTEDAIVRLIEVGLAFLLILLFSLGIGWVLAQIWNLVVVPLSRELVQLPTVTWWQMWLILFFIRLVQAGVPSKRNT